MCRVTKVPAAAPIRLAVPAQEAISCAGGNCIRHVELSLCAAGRPFCLGSRHTGYRPVRVFFVGQIVVNHGGKMVRDRVFFCRSGQIRQRPSYRKQKEQRQCQSKSKKRQPACDSVLFSVHFLSSLWRRRFWPTVRRRFH